MRDLESVTAPKGQKPAGWRRLCYDLQWQPYPDGPAIQDVKTETPRTPKRIIIIARANSPFQQEAAKELKTLLPKAFGASAPDSIPIDIVNLGHPIVIVDESVPTLSGAFTIFLPELDMAPFLATIDKQGWDCLKRLATSDRLLWLTRFGPQKDPAYEVVFGVSRAIRTDQPELQWNTLAIDKLDDGASALARNIIKVIQDPTGEDEFALKDGELLIPRLVESDYFNDYLASRLEWSQNMTSPQLKAQNGRSWEFNPQASYVLAGGLGGVGKALALWMAQRGARNIIFLSRSGGDASPETRALISELQEKHGCTVAAPRCDIGNEEQLSTVLSDLAKEMPPVKGCLQAAMVARLSPFADLSFDDYIAATPCKIEGSMNLHNLLPDDMNFFLMLSSASSIIGLPTQTSYCAGCAYQDGLAHWRVSRGQKATAINLGLIVD